MQTYDEVRLKALFQLLQTEADAYGPVLKRELATALRQNPQQVKQLLETQFTADAPLSVVHTLQEIAWEDLAAELSRFAAKINPNLEEGLTLLSQFIDPSVRPGEITACLDEWAHQLRTPLLNATNYTDIAAALSNFFFQVQQVQLVTNSRHIKDLSFARLLRKKSGSNLCVACLYAAIGQRFALEMSLVDLAGRILIHLQSPDRSESFFIDPLDEGKLLTADDCWNYMDARCVQWEDDFLSPLSSRQIIRRLLANMIFILNKLHDERRLKYVRNYLEIMKG